MTRYRTQSPDTSPEIERILIEAWRGMTPAEKILRLRDLTLAARQLALVGIRSRHPHADGRELELRLASLHLSRDVMVRLFSWDPEQAGYG